MKVRKNQSTPASIVEQAIRAFQVCVQVLAQKVRQKNIILQCKNHSSKVASPPLMFLNLAKWKRKHYQIY